MRTISFCSLSLTFLLVLVTLLILPAQNDGQKKWEDFDPENFNEDSYIITNDWMPMKPGTRFVYTGTTLTDEDEAVPHRVIINVTDLTKKIAGVNCIVNWDLDYSNGELVEAELAFYAQDKDGNVWRIGEYPEEYDEEGNFDAAPCWFAGIQDAIPGISMLSHPWAGTPSYSQGWAPKVGFTDRGQVDELGLEVSVPMGSYENVMVIAETSEEEPGAFQLKYWAEGVGNIQVGYRGEDATQEYLHLVDVYRFGPEGLADMRAAALKLEADAYERKQNKKTYAKTPPCEIRPDLAGKTDMKADINNENGMNDEKNNDGNQEEKPSKVKMKGSKKKSKQ